MMNFFKAFKFIVIFISVVFFVGIVSDFVIARAGGGHSYSRSSGSSSSRSSSSSYSRSGSGYGSSSRSSSGSFSTAYDVIVPVAIILIIILIRYVKYSSEEAAKNKRLAFPFSYKGLRSAFSSYTNAPWTRPGALPARAVTALIEEYKRRDANFSRTVFLDFAQLLYTRFHIERGKKQFETVKFYMSPQLLDAALKSVGSPTKRIANVVIGVCNIAFVDLKSNPQHDEIVVLFESNYDESIAGENGTERWGSFELRERWKFVRDKGVLSPEPDKIEIFSCPSCGNTSQPDTDGRCPYCSNVAANGHFYWNVEQIEVFYADFKPPIEDGFGGVEDGTNLPTVFQDGLEARRSALEQSDPFFDWNGFINHAADVFMKIQTAWTSRKWEMARPYETDHLFAQHRYWMEKYIQENKRNVLEDIKISGIEICRVEVDKFYDSITVRIQARMKDYTVSLNGSSISSSSVSPRIFSEYWTFIRKSGVSSTELSTERCPNCGAPVKVSTAGLCEYCNTKVTGGDFSWVLSMIEQDEAYFG